MMGISFTILYGKNSRLAIKHAHEPIVKKMKILKKNQTLNHKKFEEKSVSDFERTSMAIANDRKAEWVNIYQN